MGKSDLFCVSCIHFTPDGLTFNQVCVSQCSFMHRYCDKRIMEAFPLFNWTLLDWHVSLAAETPLRVCCNGNIPFSPHSVTLLTAGAPACSCLGERHIAVLLSFANILMKLMRSVSFQFVRGNVLMSILPHHQWYSHYFIIVGDSALFHIWFLHFYNPGARISISIFCNYPEILLRFLAI